ncbi:arginyltransferase [Neptuniibacter sp.]|uniref:arginyltransferase n=1 Tax=Neptuniibacter sp. TaxID=1962643 RepID=UPI0026255645|nr:arginyltransferase [Neptuniibacter sp.]MCP4595317.1 arginyltransferase [Neptuniibacter sp.]
MTNLRTLHFYATPEHDCSYLPDKTAKTLFVDPHAEISQSAYSQLSDMGFRRSGKHIYRPHCEDCQACISVRIPLAIYKMSKSQKRVMSKNKDLTVKRCKPCFTQEYYTLYSRYINERHQDGDMYPPSLDQFTSFLVEGEEQTYFFEFRDQNDQLVAVSVVDMLDQGLSAIYTFYDPSLDKRSLGTFCILWQIKYSIEQGYQYLYLGYWVKSCRKMSYKIAFKPFELLIDGHWTLIQTDRK